MRDLFRPLTEAGFPHYEINMEGHVRRVGRTKLLKPRVVVVRKGRHFLGFGYQLRKTPEGAMFTLRLRRKLVAIAWGKTLRPNHIVLSVDETDHLQSLVALSQSEHALYCRRHEFYHFVILSKTNGLCVLNEEGTFRLKSAYILDKKTTWEDLKKRIDLLKKKKI